MLLIIKKTDDILTIIVSFSLFLYFFQIRQILLFILDIILLVMLIIYLSFLFFFLLLCYDFFLNYWWKFSLIDITFYNNLPLFYRGYVMEMQASAFSFAKQNWC